ncbi:hypothetical protein C8J57DRAFT_432693 [Mycena rebaudengoi]|nr:hypothetical protein C8J57DRAFT_432693 [Mycena rebaudengoi]
MDRKIWGENAAEFRPERWEHLPDAVHANPGVWASLITFFAGPPNCIGFRFSVMEQKALLFTLIRASEFTPAVPEGGMRLQRPIVLAERERRATRCR